MKIRAVKTKQFGRMNGHNINAETGVGFQYTIAAQNCKRQTRCNLIFKIYFTKLHLQIFPYLESTRHFTIMIFVGENLNVIKVIK